MATPDIQLKFWTEFLKKNKNDKNAKYKFSGTPGRRQYLDLKMSAIFPFKIRLDIYIEENDYNDKGYQTICLMVSNSKLRTISQKFAAAAEKKKKNDGRVLIVGNFDKNAKIEENADSWATAMKWFNDSIIKIVDELLKK